MSNDRELVRNHINSDVLFRCNPEKRYNEECVGKLLSNTPGKFYDHQFYMRRLTHNFGMMKRVMELMEIFIDEVIDKDFQLCGLETGSLPLITNIQAHMYEVYGEDINAFTLRKERKPYGLFNYIEGVPNNYPIVYVDDLSNSGKSFHRAASIACAEIRNPNFDPTPLAYWAIIGKPTHTDLRNVFSWDEFTFDYDESIYWEPEGML